MNFGVKWVALTVTAIIVSFNTRELLRRCLKSLDSCESVIVVDNNSNDGSPDMVESEFPDFTLVRLEKNLGFGAANNIALKQVTTDLALLLNSDAFALPGAIEKLKAVFKSTEVVAAGGRLFDPDHPAKTQPSCCSKLTLWAVFCEQTLLEKVFPMSRIFSPYWQTPRIMVNHRPSETYEVEQVMGACLMLKPGLLFDERYFLYCEDTDLCIRLRKQGKILYVPDSEFGHNLGASSQSNRWMSIARYNRGKELTFDIHNGRTASIICFVMNRLGALFRLLIWLVPTATTLGLVHAFRTKSWMFFQVLIAPISGPPNPKS